MFDKKKFQFYTVNGLTVLRLILVPVVAIFILSGLRLHAFIIFLIGIATDLLDGDLARRFNVTSKFGEIIDPIADLSLIYSAIIPLFILNEFTPIIRVVVIIGTFLILAAIIEHTIRNKRLTLPKRRASTTINSYFVYTTLAFYIINSPHKLLIAYLTCFILTLTAFDYFINHKK